MSFACPGCGAPIDGRPDRLLQQCGSCGARLSSRPVETSGPEPVFEVRVAGRPETGRRVRVPWDETARRRLSAWLLVASVVTVALVLVLFVLARIF
ncbi:MAG: hypothetical protein LJF15_01555 [Acidobacteria bacterium]|nr:hypothetical protein [Acidobacteriota bacterium]